MTVRTLAAILAALPEEYQNLQAMINNGPVLGPVFFVLAYAIDLDPDTAVNVLELTTRQPQEPETILHSGGFE